VSDDIRQSDGTSEGFISVDGIHISRGLRIRGKICPSKCHSEAGQLITDLDIG
jgi:hypothetical protein